MKKLLLGLGLVFLFLVACAPKIVSVEQPVVKVVESVPEKVVLSYEVIEQIALDEVAKAEVRKYGADLASSSCTKCFVIEKSFDKSEGVWYLHVARMETWTLDSGDEEHLRKLANVAIRLDGSIVFMDYTRDDV